MKPPYGVAADTAQSLDFIRLSPKIPYGNGVNIVTMLNVVKQGRVFPSAAG